MLPIRDINPIRSTPFVNYLLVAANLFAFFWTLGLPEWAQGGLALVPVRFVSDPPGEALTIFTSMFMHANLMHLVGNLWFLWIFGDNVEDALGHARYLAFYLLGGLVAALAQVVTNVGSPVPMVGASGAIAAVTGAYVVLFPRAPILIMNPVIPLWLFFGITFLVPAWAVAGEFFIMNLFMGLQEIGRQTLDRAPTGGVAVFAHLGGFVAGVLAVSPMMRGRERRKKDAWHGWKPPQGTRIVQRRSYY